MALVIHFCIEMIIANTWQPPSNHLATTRQPPGNHPATTQQPTPMPLLYKPGREDDYSGLQVFGLQQQGCQVGVLAKQQHLLRLEDHRPGRQVTAQGDR